MIFAKHSSGLFLTSLVTLVALASAASASELRYRPVNPHFGGNPLNSSHLQFEASSNNQHQNDDQLSTQDTISDLVTRSVSFQIANNINEAIFGVGAQATGTSFLGDGSSVSWNRVGTNVTVTFTGVDGSTTVFVVPD